MKKLISIFAVILMVSFTSCTEANKEQSKQRATNEGDEIVRKDGCHYVVIYDLNGQIATMFHTGQCPNHK